LKKLAERIGVQGNGIEDLVHNSKVQDEVLKELQQAGRQGGLSGIEIIEGAVLADEEWTPQNVSTTLDFGRSCADPCRTSQPPLRSSTENSLSIHTKRRSTKLMHETTSWLRRGGCVIRRLN
jgi:hypothetical protein